MGKKLRIRGTTIALTNLASQERDDNTWADDDINPTVEIVEKKYEPKPKKELKLVFDAKNDLSPSSQPIQNQAA